jgi:predicted dinucleotide-binding enzyme
MTISDSTVAIIGTGNIGSRLAANFAAGGQDFLLAGHDQQAQPSSPPTSAATRKW